MRPLALALLLLATWTAAAGAATLRQPTGLKTTTGPGGAVTVTWADRSAGEARYQVESGLRRFSLLGAARRYVDRRIGPGVARRYRVRACAAGRCGPWSASVRGQAALPPAAGAGPNLGGCAVFPADSAWNQRVDTLPVHARSAVFIRSIGDDDHVHPDFGSDPSYGIPFIVVGASQRSVPIRFVDYGDESDPGPYPIPLDAPIEAGGDRHVLALQSGTCRLYELYAARPVRGRWEASSGARFDLRSNALRPDTWTSADAAGLPILPGLVRRDEVRAGHIDHALRVTVPRTQRGFIHPATHYGFTDDQNDPPMGLRLRLKASYDLSGYTGAARVILEAARAYGLIVADNGSGWYISGTTDAGWNDEDLNQLKDVPGNAFEAVETGPIVRP